MAGKDRRVNNKEGLDKGRAFVYKGGVQDAALVLDDTQDTVFWTVGKVAKMLSVHPRTVRNWIATGELKAIKLGSDGSFRITDAHLQAYLNRNLTTGGRQQ